MAWLGRLCRIRHVSVMATGDADRVLHAGKCLLRLMMMMMAGPFHLRSLPTMGKVAAVSVCFDKVIAYAPSSQYNTRKQNWTGYSTLYLVRF